MRRNIHKEKGKGREAKKYEETGREREGERGEEFL